MYDFIRGPLLWIAFIVFWGGLIYQITEFFRLTRRKEPVFAPPLEKAGKREAAGPSGRWIGYFRETIVGTHPVMAVVTFVFHTFLFVVPIFLLAHSILFYESFGVSPWSLSESTTDVLTMIVLLCCAFFLVRRIFVRRVRAISTAYDYIILLIAVAPFLFGYMAYHQWFDYRATVTAHILAGEVMLIVIPFTKLGHMVFFFLYRFLVGSEYSFGQGSRTW